MIKPFQLLLIAWRIWRAHSSVAFCRIMWYYLKARLTGEWETWLWACAPASGRIAIDAGANTGQWTFKLADRFRQVIAIEPHPGTARRLRDRAPFNVAVVEGAAWDKSVFKTLILYPDLRICRITDHDLLYSMGKGSNGVKVLAFPIDALRLQGVDFIKLDVEGAEAEALEGALQTIKASSPVMLIELHSSQARERIEATLSLLGYEWDYRYYPFYRPGDYLYQKRLWILARKDKA